MHCTLKEGIMIDTLEIYCLTWSGTDILHKYGCYDNLERAEKHMKQANKARKWYHKLTGHYWIVKTLELKLGKQPPSAQAKTTT